MRIAITGATGFVGKYLVDKHLQLGDSVSVLTRSRLSIPNVEVFQADLTSPGLNLTSFLNEIDVLYHCAGVLSDESKMEQLHVHGTKELIKFAKGNVGRWVQLSSVGVYGPCQAGSISESSHLHPNNVYEKSKLESDELIMDSGIEYSILRPSIVFGESMTNQSLFSMIRMINAGWFFYIGKSGAKMNYVHVNDVVQALYLCGTHADAKADIFNLSQTISIEHMVPALGGESCQRIPLAVANFIANMSRIFPGIPLTSSRINALTSRCSYSSDKIQETLGFEFSSPLSVQFEKFAQAYAENR